MSIDYKAYPFDYDRLEALAGWRDTIPNRSLTSLPEPDVSTHRT